MNTIPRAARGCAGQRTHLSYALTVDEMLRERIQRVVRLVRFVLNRFFAQRVHLVG
jgi:hypothetical protein